MSFKCDSATYHGKPTVAYAYMHICLYKIAVVDVHHTTPVTGILLSTGCIHFKLKNKSDTVAFFGYIRINHRFWASSSAKTENVCPATKVNATQATNKRTTTTTNEQIEEWRTSSDNSFSYFNHKRMHTCLCRAFLLLLDWLTSLRYRSQTERH